MNLQPRRNRNVGRRVLAGLVFFVVLGVFQGPIVTSMTRWTVTLMGPLMRLNRMVFNNYDSNIQEVLLERVRILEEENAVLKNFLGYQTDTSRHYATVISSILSSPYDTLIIDQGEAQGLALGDKAYTPEGIVLGEIVELYEHLSKIELYSAYGTTIEVKINNDTRVLARGIGSQNYSLNLPSGLNVGLGDYLWEPGSGANIVAIVEKIDLRSNDAFQTIYARIPINLNTLSDVYIQ